jgi:hypothetical protein
VPRDLPRPIDDLIRDAQGSGDPLGGRLRSALEHAYVADLAPVRVHTDARADRICRALGAEALTVGADVFFAAGRFAPGSRAGLELLAHEVAHTTQDGGPYEAAVSLPGDACEAEARALADTFVRGATTRRGPARRVRRLTDADRRVVRRHASWEHRLLGDAPPADLNAIALKTPDRQRKLEDLHGFLEMWRERPEDVTPEAIAKHYPTIRTLRLGTSGLLVTYGELNTLADHLASPSSLDGQPLGILEQILQTIRQESSYWVNHLLGKETKPHFARSVAGNTGWKFADLLRQTDRLDKLTLALGPGGIDHYKALVGRNACHFAPGSWYRWETYYLIARDYATQAHHAGSAEARDRLAHLAWINHGYADHFLQDSFAAGHLINKTLVMQWFVEWAASKAGKFMPVADWKMVQTMTTDRQPGLAARALYDGFLDPAKRGVVRDPQTADEQWALQRRMDVAGVAADGARPQIDAYKHYLALLQNTGIQLATGVLHDELDEKGLWVTSAEHTTPYQIYGDCAMLDGGAGAMIAAETAQLSQTSILELISKGGTAITAETLFRRFPTSVRENDTTLPLQEWNTTLRDRATRLFPSLKVLGVRLAEPRIKKVSIDMTGGWRWEELPGRATDLAVGGDGSVWAVSREPDPAKGYAVLRLKDGAWVPAGVGGVRVAVDGLGNPWVVDRDGGIWRRNGGDWEAVTEDGIPAGKDAAGDQVSGASDIGAGADGSVWVTARTGSDQGHPILRWTGQRWQAATGAAVAISVAPNGLPWTADAHGAIGRLNSGGPLGDGWTTLPGLAEDIAVSTGVQPTAWIIGTNDIEAAGGRDIYAWNGERWDLVDGRAIRIAVGPDGTPWTVDVAGVIRHLVPATASAVTFNTADAGQKKGRAVAAHGSLFPGDTVQINGDTDLSGVIAGKSNACIHSIKLVTSGGYYDFKLEVDGQGPKGFRSGTLDLTFVDENNTSYNLMLFDSTRKKHTLRYDSDRPGIKEIHWK